MQNVFEALDEQFAMLKGELKNTASLRDIHYQAHAQGIRKIQELEIKMDNRLAAMHRTHEVIKQVCAGISVDQLEDQHESADWKRNARRLFAIAQTDPVAW